MNATTFFIFLASSIDVWSSESDDDEKNYDDDKKIPCTSFHALSYTLLRLSYISLMKKLKMQSCHFSSPALFTHSTNYVFCYACSSHLSLHCTHCCTLHLTSHTCHINISFLIYRVLSSLWRDAARRMRKNENVFVSIPVDDNDDIECHHRIVNIFLLIFFHPIHTTIFSPYSSIQSSLNEKIFQLQRETTLESVSIATWRARDAIHRVDDPALSLLHLSATVECSLNNYNVKALACWGLVTRALTSTRRDFYCF